VARGTWDDFSDKWGFSDGAGVEQRDFDARSIVTSRLNGLPEFNVARIRAVPYDRPGVHNPCLIILLPNPNHKSDDQLLADWTTNKTEAVQLPEGNYDVDEIICEAYDQLEVESQLAKSKPKIQLLSDRKRRRR